MSFPDIPDDILLAICANFTVSDGISFIQVCSTFRAVASYRAFWVSILKATRQKGVPLACPDCSDFSEYDLNELRAIAFRAVAVRNVFKGDDTSEIRLEEIFHRQRPNTLLCTLPGTLLALSYTQPHPDFRTIRIECEELKTGQRISHIDVQATHNPHGQTDCYCSVVAPVWENVGKEGYLVALRLSIPRWDDAELFVIRVEDSHSEYGMQVQLHIPNWFGPNSQLYGPLLEPLLSSELTVQPVSSDFMNTPLYLLVFAHSTGRKRTITTDIPCGPRYFIYRTGPGTLFLTSSGDLELIVNVREGFRRVRVPRSMLPYDDSCDIEEPCHCSSELISGPRPYTDWDQQTGFMACCQSGETTLVTRFTSDPVQIDWIGSDGAGTVTTFNFPQRTKVIDGKGYATTKASSPKQTAHILCDYPNVQLLWWDLEADRPTLHHQLLQLPVKDNTEWPPIFLFDDARGEILTLRYDHAEEKWHLRCYSLLAS